MTQYKNQHYVPRTYLKNFTFDANQKMMWVADKADKTIKPRSIAITCSKNFYYSYNISKNDWNHIVEFRLGKHETLFANISKKIINQTSNVLSSQTNLNLEKIEQDLIYKFVILQVFRVPTFLDPILNGLLKEFKEINFRHQIDETDEVIFNAIKRDFIPEFLDINNQEFYGRVFKLFKKKRINIVKINRYTKERFITSDTPVLVTNPNKPNALIEPDTEYFFPISPEIAIAIYGLRLGLGVSLFECHSESRIQHVNKLLSQQANQFIMSNRKENLCLP